jgi:hypothetical protein
LTNAVGLVDCPDTATRLGVAGTCARRIGLGLFDGKDRRHVAVVITTDGRRVSMPVQDDGLVDLSFQGILRSLALGLESLLVLITGSRRENGGTRRDERR